LSSEITSSGEKAEPKVVGLAPSGPLKTAIAVNAMEGGVTTIVKAEVSKVKAALGI
jgi:hypothetical protein